MNTIWDRGAVADYTDEGAEQTTDATVTILNTIAVPTDSAMGLKIDVWGIKDDGSKVLHLVRHSTYKNDGGVVTKNPESGYASNAHYERDDTDHSVDENISGTTTQIRVTGKVGDIINWTSRIEVFL